MSKERKTGDTEWIKLEDGLAILRRPHLSKNWYVWIDKPQHGVSRLQRSLRIADKGKAQRKAYALLENVENREFVQGVINTAKPISFYNDQVKAAIEFEKSNKGTTADLRKVFAAVDDFVDYLGDLPANRLTSELLQEYFLHKEFRSPSPWRYSNRAVKNFIKILLKNRLLDPYEPPEYPKFNDKLTVYDRRRDIFEDFELKIIFDALEDFKYKPSKNKITEENRLIFYYLCHFLYHTGMRHGTEVHGLKWESIETTEKAKYSSHQITSLDRCSYVIYMYEGKTIKRSTAYPLNFSSAKTLRDFAAERCESIISSSAIGGHPASDLKTFTKIVGLNGPIFSRWDGKLPIFWDVWDSFYKPLKKHMRKDAKHTLYSFRHTFIDRLLYNYDIQKVAYLARTSPDMIYKFYSKHDALKSADQDFIDM